MKISTSFRVNCLTLLLILMALSDWPVGIYAGEEEIVYVPCTSQRLVIGDANAKIDYNYNI